MFIEPYLATVTVFAGNFAPRSWAFCNGDLLSIAEYTSLFALIGTTYGGDGQTTFALPDLRSRYAIHQGQGQGLPAYTIGQAAGTENTTLTTLNLPAHNHIITSVKGQPKGHSDSGNSDSPSGGVPADVTNRYTTATGDGQLQPSVTNTSTAVAGGNLPVSNISPYLAMNFIICVEGIFPSRN